MLILELEGIGGRDNGEISRDGIVTMPGSSGESRCSHTDAKFGKCISGALRAYLP